MFQIDLKSRKAVYDQIVDNFKRLVDTGVLKRGEDIPNVKELAKTLIINPNTIQKAYLELENQGYFCTDEGQAWAITELSDNTEKNESSGVMSLYGRLHADIQELIAHGQSREEIGKLIGMSEKAYIEIFNLSKSFNGVTALNKLNLNVKKGSIYGLVGVNGSGKTTTLKILAGIYQQDGGGSVRIDGMLVYDNAHQKIVGYMPEDLYFLPDYNMKRLRQFFNDKHKSTWNNKRYQELMELFKLNETQTVNTFSRGMQKQAGFILAISAMPDVLLLDETIDGLDPIVRKQAFKYIIEDVAEREMTVLVTSHNMRELDGICDTVGIIKDGHMAMERDLEDMRANIHKIQVAFTPDFLSSNFPYDALDVLHMEEMGSTDVLVVRGKDEEIFNHIQTFKPLLYDHLPMTLEEIFIYETEEKSDD